MAQPQRFEQRLLERLSGLGRDRHRPRPALGAGRVKVGQHALRALQPHPDRFERLRSGAGVVGQQPEQHVRGVGLVVPEHARGRASGANGMARPRRDDDVRRLRLRPPARAPALERPGEALVRRLLRHAERLGDLGPRGARLHGRMNGVELELGQFVAEIDDCTQALPRIGVRYRLLDQV